MRTEEGLTGGWHPPPNYKACLWNPSVQSILLAEEQLTWSPLRKCKGGKTGHTTTVAGNLLREDRGEQWVLAVGWRSFPGPPPDLPVLLYLLLLLVW